MNAKRYPQYSTEREGVEEGRMERRKGEKWNRGRRKKEKIREGGKKTEKEKPVCCCTQTLGYLKHKEDKLYLGQMNGQ